MEVLDRALRKPNSIKDTEIRKEKDETQYLHYSIA